MSNIPRARELLEELRELTTDEKAVSKINEILSHMTRRKPTRKTKASSRKMSPVVVKNIRWLALVEPKWSCQKIATAVGVNAGRVSEVLAEDTKP